MFDYDPDLYTKMVRYPLEVLGIFDIVLMNKVGRINPLFEKHIQTRIFNLKSSTSMRNLNPSDVERMVSLKGMIIRSSSIIPEIREAIFRCLVCGYYSDPVVINRGNFIWVVVMIIGLICVIVIVFVEMNVFSSC
ncbi:DNA replication licensing factor MCM4-like [Quercus robur]|uniref:DNA replication licensing factor MCM4-like n=1 Tax=Quercus robur TaxID=38942 RepID=UPI0021620453|nr:DNA replication licensing factor MCM4-like [Quercus robur]